MEKLFRKIKKIFRHPEILIYLLVPNRLLPDHLFLKCIFPYRTGQRLNLKNPVLYNEKLQWLKLYDRQSDYTYQSDKYEVRKYIAETIGEEYLIPLYGVWDSFDEIPFDELPNQFVLKANHDSTTVVICKDKRFFDYKKKRQFFNKRLGRNFYWKYREWAYKDIKPRIIAEKFLVDESGNDIKDYKIFCFNGEPKIIQVDLDRFTNHKRNFYSPQWEFQPLINERPNIPQSVMKKPDNLELMLSLARKLSTSKIHVRVDLYNVNNKVYFGEMTFYDGAGYNIYEPPEWNKTFGDWMILPHIS